MFSMCSFAFFVHWNPNQIVESMSNRIEYSVVAICCVLDEHKSLDSYSIDHGWAVFHGLDVSFSATVWSTMTTRERRTTLHRDAELDLHYCMYLHRKNLFKLKRRQYKNNQQEEDSFEQHFALSRARSPPLPLSLTMHEKKTRSFLFAFSFRIPARIKQMNVIRIKHFTAPSRKKEVDNKKVLPLKKEEVLSYLSNIHQWSASSRIKAFFDRVPMVNTRSLITAAMCSFPLKPKNWIN